MTEPSRDAYLPVLTETEGDRLRTLVTDTLRARGIDIREFDRDAVVTDENDAYGLGNLARALARTPDEDWPATVQHHFDRLLATATQPAMLSAADLGDVLPRLLPVDVLTPAAHPNAPDIIPGVKLVLSVDRPHEVITPSEDELTVLGEKEPVWTAAWANLRRLTAATEFEVVPLEHGVHLVGSASYFTATMAMFVEDLLQRAGLDLGAGLGTLVAVPCHGVAAVGPVGPSVTETEQAVHLLAAVAAELFEQEQGPLSPLVCWLHRGTWLPVAGPEDDGDGVLVDLPEPLRRLLEH